MKTKLFKSARVADMTDRQTIARASVHRASLPLQAAAAAELINDSNLEDLAFSNFQQRFDAGTIQDPDRRCSSRSLIDRTAVRVEALNSIQSCVFTFIPG
ncbi:hypothetical protein J7E83_14350 [Arthrobacter sp. ISL-48]|uniref:hypothetical protein n=1 Tax=Arthrobacter sp. ISL-48 TaxID=2819110 RepID=UPI001BEC37B5|nr:hypothetical protein [Arthrobacter sp. ISL-48]MBT2533279.1 hypothetical protein [Arthrobacter sp. ISL-48]